MCSEVPQDRYKRRMRSARAPRPSWQCLKWTGFLFRNITRLNLSWRAEEGKQEPLRSYTTCRTHGTQPNPHPNNTHFLNESLMLYVDTGFEFQNIPVSLHFKFPVFMMSYQHISSYSSVAIPFELWSWHYYCIQWKHIGSLNTWDTPCCDIDSKAIKSQKYTIRTKVLGHSGFFRVWVSGFGFHSSSEEES